MQKRLTALSNRAIELALALPTTDRDRMARWLYRYGTLPRSANYEHILGEGDASLSVLGLSKGGQVRGLLEANYDAATYEGWIGFSKLDRPVDLEPSCKLYVSPVPKALANAFPIVASVFGNRKVPAFKIGRGLNGLLRADKIVAHFYDRSHLKDVANELEDSLSEFRAQGVPFTAQLDSNGMLSWGIDPPITSEPLSWRVWITRLLASELLDMKESAASPLSIKPILDSIAKSGIDPYNWTVEHGVFGNIAC